MLARMARVWQCRPSDLIRGLPEVTAFQIDACAVLCLREQNEEPQPEFNGNDIYL